MKVVNLVGIVGCLIPGALAAWLWFDQPAVADARQVAILSGVTSGSIVAAAVFLAESLRDRRAAAEGEQQAVRIQLALTRDLSGADIKGRDLRRLDLRGKKILNANLQGCNLSGMDLSDTDFKGSNLRGAKLKDCMLTYSDLRFVDARGSSFRGANMIFSDLRGGLFGGCDMQQVDAQGADCRAVSVAEYQEIRAVFEVRFRSRVSGVEWTPSDIGYPTRLERVHAEGSSWRGANFENAALDGANFSFATFGAGYPRDTTFRESLTQILSAIRKRSWGMWVSAPGWSGGAIPRTTATFDGATVEGAIFEGCSGPDIQFSEIQLLSCSVPIPLDSRRPEPTHDKSNSDADGVTDLPDGESD